jgi:heterodisulfide reductase subunit A
VAGAAKTEGTLISLEIDGRRVSVPDGSTILDAARVAGVRIPTLCYSPLIEPYAACRICSVEAEFPNGKRRIVTACNYAVWEGIKVFSDNEKVRRIRRMIVEMLLARSSHVKVIQELAREYGVGEGRLEKQREGCILCGLCVRVCAEVVGKAAISFAGRGLGRRVSSPYDRPTDDCIACGACAAVCPTGVITIQDTDERVIAHDELSLGPTKAITVPFMQAVPNAPYIRQDRCIHFQTGACGHCAEICDRGAIDYEMKEEVVDVDVGNIIVATGFDLFDASAMTQYGYGRFKNVVTALEFEHLNCASGPTGGRILLTNGKTPAAVGIVHCVGSRDQKYHEYCSRVCCMYALKYAHLIKEKTNAEVFNFYIDLRCFGKGYEEFYDRLLREDVRFVRGKVGEISQLPIGAGEEGKLVVRVEDTLLGTVRRIPVDMAILCPAMEARADAKDVSRVFSCSLGRDGFFIEKHPKLAPVSTTTDGVFIAGACQGPKDIPDTVAQGGAAAAEVLSLIDRKEIEVEAATSVIDEERCSGCRICNTLCPFGAISFDGEKKVSVINAALCKGCGTCAAACPQGVISARHFTDRQIISEIEGMLR